jgi:hypothetical protein
MSRFGLLGLLILTLADPAAAMVTVDSTSDGDDGECLIDCTIREAVATAVPGDTVFVPAGTYFVSLGAISIDRDLMIAGDGARHTVIRGSTTPQRIFVIEAGFSVEISALSLSLEPDQSNGGGIRNDGDLVLRDCWLRDTRNPLDVGGGTLRNTVTGTATVERCTLSNNNAEFGGAVLNEGVLVLESTTVSGNSNAFFGGGILNSGGSVTLNGSTVIGNVALFQGAANIQNASGDFVVRNSVVSGGVGGPDCTGEIDVTAGHSLDGDGTCIASGGPNNLTATANLEPLADNGGPVPTHAPMPGSPVIDAGNPGTPGSGGDACSAMDARGVARPQGATCDIGAFELATGQACAGGAADDADGDGLCRADDNCPGGFNPAQGVVVFPHTLVATAADRFAWDEVADVSFVRGDLDQVDVYGTNDNSELVGADSLTDDELPAAGSGFYYLVRLGGECTVGSWQTRLGGQPARDQSLP